MPDFGPVGGTGGKPFDDIPPSSQMEIGGVLIRSGSYLDQLQLIYRDPSSGQLVLGQAHGGNGGQPSGFVLNPGEYLTGVSGRTGSYVDSITFQTSQGRTFGRFGGGGGGTDYQLPAPTQANLELFGFYGRSGAYVDSIGCHTRQRRPLIDFAIAGVEVTQAIQYWNSPAGQGSGFAAANSIPLVSERETILRVYANVGGGATQPPATLSGLVTVTGFSLALGYGSSLYLQPIGGPIAAKPLSGVQRSSAGDTLNFRIPADVSQGQIHCAVKVFDPANPADVSETFIDLSFRLVPRLGVHGVLVHYTGVDYFDKPVDAQPNGLDLAVTLDWVFRTYPIPGIDYNGCVVLPWSAKLAVTQNFYDLFGTIASLKAMSRSSDIYVGLLPPAAGCGGICGLGGAGSALLFAGNGPEAAHEIGHALGRAHTQCAITSSGADPNYPNYDAFPQGSIGECGVDGFQISTFDPRTTFDFMSYCGPVWISPYTYLGLMNAITTTYAAAQPTAAFEPASIWGVPAAEFLYLQFRLHRRPREKPVEVRSAFSLAGVPPRPAYVLPTEIVVELVDGDDRLVASYPCAPLDPHQDQNDAFEDVEVTVPVLSDVRTIRIIQRGAVISVLQPVEHSPVVEITEMTRSEGRDLVRVRWRAEADPKADPGLQYGLRYTNDGGETWRALAAGLTEAHYVLNLDLLPGGSECRIQVIASAGLRSAVAETAPIEVARKSRQAYILLPAESSVFEYGEVIPLMGGGFSPDHGMAPFEETVWTSSTRGMLGTGYRLPVRGLPIGRHLITVHVPDGQGGEAVMSREVRVMADADSQDT